MVWCLGTRKKLRFTDYMLSDEQTEYCHTNWPIRGESVDVASE